MLQPGTLLQEGRYRVIRVLGHGGFGQTYEVDDGSRVKVLKVLLQSYPRAICLFQREAKVLSQLNHPGIPKVELDSYFCFKLEDSSEPLHCLVMEKIPGLDLRRWLSDRDHQPITQTLAADWLRQLVEILAQIHPQYFHRDIKPSNIMLKPDGQLVLIDFGGVREVTETYLNKRQDDLTDLTRLCSRGYTPIEQSEGRAVPQSDFFALGRTFVHLLTGKSPFDFLSSPETGQLIWRSNAPQISESLADLIDWLMQPFPAKRPENVQVILEALELVEGADAITPLVTYQDTTKPSPNGSTSQSAVVTRTIGPSWRKVSWVFLWSMLVTTCVMGVRSLGWLQSWELKAFDKMMQLRPAEPPDNRLLIVEITNKDIDQLKDQYPLSDAIMLRLLQKLDESEPQVIGIDIYRDRPEGKGRADLVRYLQQSDRIFSPCVHSEGNDPGIQPPTGVSENSVGFIDTIENPNSILRRYLFATDRPYGSLCPAYYALSFRLALHYLEAKEYHLSVPSTSAAPWQIGSIRFEVLETHRGFYHQQDVMELLGHQILLNYRASKSLDHIAERVTLTQVLTNQVKPDLINGRIILIGVTDPRLAKDEFNTPYNQETRGLLLHAQMVSQLISAVENRRPLLSFWHLWGDAIWVLGWSLMGGVIALYFRPLLSLGLVEGVILISLCGISFTCLLTNGVLVPLVPSALSLIITGGIVAANPKFQINRQK